MKKTTEKTAVPVNNTKELQAVDQSLQDFRVLSAKKITSEEGLEAATAALKELKALKAKVNSVFETQLTSAKATVKAINAELKKHLDPIEALDSALRLVTSAWLQKQAQLAEAARQKAEEKREAKIEKLEAKGKEVPASFMLPISAPSVNKGGIKTREIRHAEVTDPHLVPKEYWIIDEAGLESLAKATKGDSTIPGVRFYSETITVI